MNILSATSSINIPINIPESSRLMVYHNGILLTLNEHYTVSGTSSITLLDYIAESGDVISFVYHNL